MIVLDYRDSRPLYQQVKDSLRRMMLTGLLEPGEKLPSVRSLATQLAINRGAVAAELKRQLAPLHRKLDQLQAENRMLRAELEQLKKEKTDEN